MRPQHRVFCLVILRLTLLTGLLCGVPAFAFDQVKAAENMARQAATAFEQGDHLRAAQLYLQAYASDSRMVEYLYGAARAEHVGNTLDLAEEHYQKYIAKAGSGKRVENAKKFLAEVQNARADLKATDAERAGRMENWPLAAQLFHTAFELAPTRWTFLYRESMACEQSGQKAETRAILERYLRDAPADARDRPEAQMRLNTLNKSSKPGERAPEASRPLESAKAPETAKAAVAKPTELSPGQSAAGSAPVVAVTSGRASVADRETQRLVAWSTAGAGAALALTGLGLAIWASADRANLDKQLAVDGTTGLIGDISYSEAKAKQEAIGNRRIAAAVVGGAGVAAAAVGAWLLWRAYPSDTPVSFAPTPSSLQLLVRF